MIKEKTKQLLLKVERLREKVAYMDCITQNQEMKLAKEKYSNYIVNCYKHWRTLGEQKISSEITNLANNYYNNYKKCNNMQNNLLEIRLNLKKLKLLIN